jgi:prepilin-type N-terminal cleavage/methylation domain-containing protein
MRRGFTLIELLIVISILALLIGLFAPALASARTASRNTVCSTQLHELGLLHFEQAWDLDRFAQSAYDLKLARFETVADRGDFGYRGRNGGTNMPPGGTTEFARKLFEAENAAPAQPPSWRIPCPQAKAAGEQSYGLNWRFRSVMPDRITGIDLIFGDSPYRLVARGLDLAPRHNNEVNFLYGDQHVAAGGEEQLKDEDAHRRTWRGEPVPAEYPDR